ncbi:bestrophin-like domain [Spirosoma arcticum]
MPTAYYLLQMPPVLLLFLLIGLFIGISTGSTLLFRRYVRLTTRHAENQGVGDVFALVGGLYALLLGFVVFLVWDSFNEAQTNADREGSLARGLYRTIRYYPDSAKVAPLMSAYLTYVRHVTRHEFPHMETMQPFTKEDRQAFNGVFRRLEAMNTGDLRTDQMFRHLNDLATYRNLRQLDTVSGIPGPIWMALIIGGVVLLLFAMLLDIASLRLHLIVNSVLSTFIGLVVYIILILDHPFTGQIKIEPEAYRQILTMADEDR